MGQAPEMLLPPARCFAPFTQPSWDDCGFVTRQEADRRQLYVNATLRTLAKNHRSVFFFSPFSELCDNAYCYAIKDRSLHYFDNDHLNLEGALLLSMLSAGHYLEPSCCRAKRNHLAGRKAEQTEDKVRPQAVTLGFVVADASAASFGFCCGLGGAKTRIAARMVPSVKMYATACITDGRSS